MEERTRHSEVRDAWDEEGDDNQPAAQRAPLTREEVQALREKYPPLSPWRVIAVQAVVGLAVAILGGFVTGRAAVGWSALYGAAAVVVPGVLMARGITRGGRHPGAAVFGFLFWEFIKIAVAVAMLAAATVVVHDLNWPALLVAMVVCMKVNWLALLWQGRVRATKKRS